MIRRCSDPTFKDWHLYGGRISNPVIVCARWLSSYEAFVSDMGARPSAKHTLDRINGALGYEPSNCRWATPKQQARNTSTNHLIQYKGDTRTLAEWAERAGMKSITLYMRLKRGWPFEKALLTPLTYFTPRAG